MAASGPPPSAIELSFEALHEGWSEYKVKDGEHEVQLKAKLILLKIFVESIDEQGSPRFGAATNLIFTVKVPQDLKGTKSDQTYSTQELVSSITAEDIPFETLKEEWNDYRVEKDIVVSVKPIITVISRTSKYDTNRDPVYFVQHQEIVKGKVPKEARDRLKNLFTAKPSPSEV